MSIVEIKQITSKGDSAGQAFLNVDEEYGHVNVWSSCNGRKTFLLCHREGGEFHLVQFDRDVSDKEIKSFFEDKKKHFSIIEIQMRGELIQVK